MFGIDFYPTPKELINTMIDGLELNGANVLEPSAGHGNIVTELVNRNAKVFACEIDENLRSILATKECKIIANDFMQVKEQDISHVDYIVMNPPFSRDMLHIRHAWNIAPSGCEIVALCNAETLRRHKRHELGSILYDYGHFIEIENAFSKAERKTDVKIALLHLYKPRKKNENEFDGFFMDEDEEDNLGEGLREYDFIRDVVNRYVEAIKIFDEQLESAKRMNNLTSSFFKPTLALSFTQKEAVITREQFKIDLQKSAWNFIIGKMGMNKYATTGLREDINRFVHQQSNIPFTMKNVYRMIEIVIGTTGSRMDRALEEAFDNITKHYHNNRYGVEGWKTNSHYLINEKLIIPNVFQYDLYGKIMVSWSSYNYDKIVDLTKALCYVTGANYNEMGSLREILNKNNIQNNETFEWAFFEVKGFKKGTGHFKFKDKEVWATFNREVSRIKGYPLPEKI